MMSPLDSAGLKTYKITIYLCFSDDYSQKNMTIYRYFKFDIMPKTYFRSNDRWIAYDLLVVMAEIYILSQLSPNCQILHLGPIRNIIW